MLMSSASSARSADCLLAFTFSPSGHIAFFGADVHQEGRKEERKRKEEDISTWLNFPLFAKVGGSGLPSPLPSFLFQPSSPGMFTVRSRKAPCPLPSRCLTCFRIWMHHRRPRVYSMEQQCHSIRWRREREGRRGRGRGPPWQRRCRQRRDRWRPRESERCREEPIICSPIHSLIWSVVRKWALALRKQV